MPTTKSSRFGKLPPRYNFVFNPYPDMRLSSCPYCNGKTGQRKLPLVIHVAPENLIALNYTCRYCRSCDLLIAHKPEVEYLLYSLFNQSDPDVIGNEYLVIGTAEKEVWREGMKQPLSLQDMVPHVSDFKAYYKELRFTQPGWYPEEEEPPVMEPLPSEEWVKAKTRQVTRKQQKGSLMPKQRSETVPAAVQPAYTAIVDLIVSVCQQHLNDEYATLGRELAAALARKRPSPITRGKPEVWACGIMYALGTVNFLFDKSHPPYLRADELCAAFGVSPSSGSAKAKQIREMFGMFQLDPRWCLPGLVDQNPLVWMLEVNGFVVDIRHMPREAQEAAYQKGLIPYIPADRHTKDS